MAAWTLEPQWSGSTISQKMDRNFSSQRVFTLLARLRFRLRISDRNLGDHLGTLHEMLFNASEKEERQALEAIRNYDETLRTTVILQCSPESRCLESGSTVPPRQKVEHCKNFLKVMLALRLQILNLEQLLHPRSVA